jgi:hypothetical protein
MLALRHARYVNHFGRRILLSSSSSVSSSRLEPLARSSGSHAMSTATETSSPKAPSAEAPAAAAPPTAAPPAAPAKDHRSWAKTPKGAKKVAFAPKRRSPFFIEATADGSADAVRKRLDDPETAAEVIAQVNNNLEALSATKPGSYLVSDAIKKGTAEQKKSLAKKVTAKVHTLLDSKFGEFVIRAGLAEFAQAERDVLACVLLSSPAELRKLIRDPIKHRVIANMMNHLSELEETWMLQAFRGHVVELCMHGRSTHVIQRAIKHFRSEGKRQLLAELCGNRERLRKCIFDQFGHYCVVDAIKWGTSERHAAIAGVFQQDDGMVMKAATHESARFVLAKVIEQLPGERTHSTVEQVLNNMVRKDSINFIRMATGQLPGLILLSILSSKHVDEAQRQEVIAAMVPHMKVICCSEFGHFTVQTLVDLVNTRSGGDRNEGAENGRLEAHALAAIDYDSADGILALARDRYGSMVVRKLLKSKLVAAKTMIEMLNGRVEELTGTLAGCTLLQDLVTCLSAEEREELVASTLLASPKALQLATNATAGVKFLIKMLNGSEAECNAVLNAALDMPVLQLANSSDGVKLIWQVLRKMPQGSDREAFLTKMASDPKELTKAANNVNARALIQYFQGRARGHERAIVRTALPSEMHYIRRAPRGNDASVAAAPAAASAATDEVSSK